MQHDSPFTYTAYRRFLDVLKRTGTAVFFREWTEGSKVFLLRHDVDLCVGPALAIAKLETEAGVKSTYFFRVTSQSYNVLAPPNDRMIREIADRGFEVGLHFDPSVYGGREGGGLAPAARQEAETLSFVAGQPVRSVSLHAPSIHGQWPRIEGYVNAYDPRIFSDEVYISDSRMLFRGKNLFTFIERVRDHTVQVLLHPLHFGEVPRTYPDILADHLKTCIRALDEEWRLCSSTYCGQLKGTLLEHLVRRASES